LIILLFSILWGILFTLILISPTSYYPLLFAIFVFSILIFVFSRKYFTINIKYIPAFIIFFFFSYALCSYFVFMPKKSSYPNFSNLDNLKKAVIFYSEGEMEKYTPFYANYFLKNKNLLSKPFLCYKIKRFYYKIGTNYKNDELLKVARELKKSLLNYKPYYFYIAFEGYVPKIQDAINSAIKDGCKTIYIVNYTSREIDSKINKEVDLEFLRDRGITIKFTRPIYTSDIFINYYVNKINNLPKRFKGILIYDDKTNTSEKLKDRLVKYGFLESGILISKDLKFSFDYYKSQNISEILFVNLASSGCGYEEEILMQELTKYTASFKIHAIKSWGYDIELVKAAINEFKKIEN